MTENNILEEYYREMRPSKRELLLEQMSSGEDDAENRLRREIYEMRYDRSRKAGNEPVDRFMALWMLMKVSANNLGGLFGKRGVRKTLTRELGKLGIPKFLEGGEMQRELLCREFYHLASAYIQSSRTDRSYGSAFLGMVSIKDDQVCAKLAEDVYKVGYQVPRAVEMEEQFALLAKAAREAFIDLLPDYRRYLDDMIFGNQP